VAAAPLEGRAFFEHQQQRRQEIQARLTNKPGRRRLPQPEFVSPTATTQTIPIPSVAVAPAPRILLTSGANAGQAFHLPQGELTIGREEGCEIQLDDPRVSHNHALLLVHGNNVMIKDLRSTNGTKVNGTTIERQTALAPGDEINVGGVELRLETG
jgi:pSer/pThr/pTyr-binding forkhead associated (FHA) protein